MALSCLSWFQLPRSGWSQVSALPLTLSAALEGLGVVGEGITTGTAVRIRRLGDAHFAAVVAHVAEGVVDVGQARGRTAAVDVLDPVVAAVDAPLGEVADDPRLAGSAAVAGQRGGADLGALRGRVAGVVAGTHTVAVSGRCSQAAIDVAGTGW